LAGHTDSRFYADIVELESDLKEDVQGVEEASELIRLAKEMLRKNGEKLEAGLRKTPVVD
jgi:hypothetical protein